MLPQICVGNPLKNGWFLVTQDLTRPADFRRLFYPEIRLKTAPFGADVEILEEKDGVIKVRVGIDIADCEHAMEDDHNWRLASVSGPKVTLKKDQIFIPVIYFKHCMIGVSVGQKVIDDPVVQGWLKEHELKE